MNIITLLHFASHQLNQVNVIDNVKFVPFKISFNTKKIIRK